MTNEIRYFSMFSGVGGFELGLESASNGNGKYNSEEENPRNSNRDKSISQRQEESNNSTDNREVTDTKDSNGTLLQNRQEQGNPKSRDMEEIKGDTKPGQSIRQASDGVLREGSGIRDDSESLQLGEDKSNIGTERANDISKTKGNESRGNEEDSTNTKSELLASEQSSCGERADDNRPARQEEQGLQTNNDSSNIEERDSWESPNSNRELLQGQTCENLSKRMSNTSERQTRFTCVGQSEIDKYSNHVLRYKFPTIKNWGDCTKINPAELPDFNMLCGGFPCQSFSIAGKRRGFEDTRGTMFFEVARILKVKRPKIVLLENVKGLLNHDKGETFRVILQTLDELGYEVQWMVLNSKFFGVPQNRERIFIIGNLRETSRPEILPFRCNDSKIDELSGQQTNTITARYEKAQATGSYLIKSEQYAQKDTSQGMRVYNPEGCSQTLAGNAGGLGGKTGLYEVKAVLTPDRPNKRQNGRRFKEEGEPSFTITGQDIHGVTDGIKIRRLTPVECCRLQGFPDDWNDKMSDTQRYKQMGNAVTVNVIAAIGRRLLDG